MMEIIMLLFVVLAAGFLAGSKHGDFKGYNRAWREISNLHRHERTEQKNASNQDLALKIQVSHNWRNKSL